MKGRFLITTALEETWREDVPVLFLGEWCRRYSRRERWSKMNAEVLPYHWDDRAKLYADYQHLQDFYERLLLDLSTQLNQIHRVDHGLRYWRILIGPWLGYFIQMLFDRWTNIQKASEQHELSSTAILIGQEDSHVPNDMDEFRGLHVRDEWNHHIYSIILREHTKIHCIEQTQRNPEPIRTAPPDIPWTHKMKRGLAPWISQYRRFVGRERDAFFYATYLPFFDEMRMHCRMSQLPQPTHSVLPAQIAMNHIQRRWTLPAGDRHGFEACARDLIPRQIPKVYLEGYAQLIVQTTGLPWPKRPSVICTSNPIVDDVFKSWAAAKVEQGTPLVIGQQGGGYGIGKWSFLEDHQIAICNRYLSWGWSIPGNPKVLPVGQLKSRRPIRHRSTIRSTALLVTGMHPRHSYWMYSTPVAHQWLGYLADQFSFAEHLPSNIRDVLTVRMYRHDYGWDQLQRWKDRFPSVILDDGFSDINALLRNCRLAISTYNSTTFLEWFSMDIPTIIYWNPSHWELRASAAPHFADLKRVGIFHETPESAARQVATLWDDVDTWWRNPERREVLDRFKARYCDLPNDLLGRVEHAIRDASSPSTSR